MKLTTLYPGEEEAVKVVAHCCKHEVVYEQFDHASIMNPKKFAEFLKISPVGASPVLELDDGGVIFGINSIINYLGCSLAKGHDAASTAEIAKWMEFARSDLHHSLMMWYLPLTECKHVPYNKVYNDGAKRRTEDFLKHMNEYLVQRTFFVTKHATLADIILAITLKIGFEKLFDEAVRTRYPFLTRWWLTMMHQPSFVAGLGDIKLCEKALAYVAPKKEKGKKEGKPKKEQPKKEKKEEVVEDELDELPPEFASGFTMDDFKRLYSNNETRDIFEKVWEHFDTANYKWYFASYKYNEELSKIFMASNLIGGFFQRIEHLRKVAFCSYCINGEEPNLCIEGVWLFQGTDIPAALKECDDSVLYEWKEVDIADPEQKEYLQDLLAWDGKLRGKPFGAGKVFK